MAFIRFKRSPLLGGVPEGRGGLSPLLTPFLILTIIVPATLSQPLITDRPDQTESAFIVLAGRLQIEAGIAFKRHTFPGDVITHTIAAPSLLLRYSIHPNAELRAELEYLQVQHKSGSSELTVHGVAPLTFGTKIKIFEEKGFRPETAFILHLTIPNTGAEAFQTNYTAPSFRFTMQNTLSDKFSLSYNLGGEWDGFTGKPTGIYTLSLGYSVSGKVGSFIESYGFLSSGESPDHRIDGGITYQLTQNLQADLSAGLGITNSSPDFFVGGGLSFRIPK